MNKYKDFDNYLKEFPSKDGYFGEYGGAYLPPELKKAVEEAGYPVLLVDTSEFRKLDGGLSCLSLRF